MDVRMRVGMRVQIRAGANTGVSGIVFWSGPSKSGPGRRIGVRTSAGAVLWCHEKDVEVIATEDTQSEITGPDQTETVVLELHTPKIHKLWTAILEATTLITHTARPGKNGRTYTKGHTDGDVATRALEKAIRRKYRDGYFPLDGPLPLPPPFDLDEAAVPRDSTIRRLTVPKTADGTIPRLQNRVPPQLQQYQAEYGYSYSDGPGRSNLWYKPTNDGDTVQLYLGKRHFITPVEPNMVGDKYRDLPFIVGHYPPRPDGEALLVAYQSALYELDIETGHATKLVSFESVADLRSAQPFLYATSGSTVYYHDTSTVFAHHIGSQEAEGIITVETEPILDLALLADGAIAVLQPSQLSVHRPDEGGKWTQTHAMACNQAARVSTLMTGRVLFVLSASWSTERPTAILAYDETAGTFFEMAVSAKRYREAFAYRNRHWIIEAAPGGDIDWELHQLFNLDACYRIAVEEKEPLAADAVIDLPNLHDIIAKLAYDDDETDIAALASVVERLPQTLEHRQYRMSHIGAIASASQTPLHYCCCRNDLEVLHYLIDAGADIDAVTSRGETALELAIRYGHADMPQILLEACATVLLPAEAEVDGETVQTHPPLVAAAATGKWDLVMHMLDAGAPIDASDPDGNTPLTAALEGEYWDLADELVARGASVDANGARSPLLAGLKNDAFVRSILDRTTDVGGDPGSEALLIALGKKYGPAPRPDLAHALLDAGAKPSSPAALAQACRLNDATLIERLLALGADPNGPDPENGALPLGILLCHPEPDMAALDALLDASADVNGYDRRPIRPLRYAIANNTTPDIVRTLIEHGAGTTRGESGWGPIHEAAWAGKIDMIELLIRNGAPVDEFTADGATPVVVAAENGQTDAVQVLLDAGADPDATESGWTALMAAARKNHVDIVQRLLDANADDTRKGAPPDEPQRTTRRTAQEHAEAAGADAVAALLGRTSGQRYASLHKAVNADDLDAAARMLAAGADPNICADRLKLPVLHAARSLAMVERLVGAGADVDAADCNGETALMKFARRVHDDALAMVGYLLDHGADFRVQVQSYRTALHAAVASGAVAIARRLIEGGAPINTKHRGPLHEAAAYNYAELCTLLLDHGADIEQFDYGPIAGRRTPLHEAADRGHLEVARILLEHGADPGAQDPTAADEYDEHYWAYGGYTPIHCAAEKGHFEVLKLLLRQDRSGAVHRSIARGRYTDELAEDHPECQALVRAVMDGHSVDEYDAMRAEEGRARAEALEAATAANDLYLERIDESPIPHGTRSAPDAVTLGVNDWSQTSPAGFAFCLLYRRGMYEVAIGDEEGLHELDLDEPLRAMSFSYAFSPDGRRLLVAVEQRLVHIDMSRRDSAVLLDAPSKIEKCGFTESGIYHLVGTTLSHATLTPMGLETIWELDLASGSDRELTIDDIDPTGGPVIVITYEQRPRSKIFAIIDENGLAYHSLLENSGIVQVWYYRAADKESEQSEQSEQSDRERDGTSVFARTSWSDLDAAYYRIHNVGAMRTAGMAARNGGEGGAGVEASEGAEVRRAAVMTRERLDGLPKTLVV